MTTYYDQSIAVGFTAFAAVVLIIVGIFHAIAGIAALVNDTFYAVDNGWVFEFDVTTWGWIHLLVGIVLVLSGIGLFSGNLAARIVGVAVAAVSAIANFAWLPYQPLWSLTMIMLAVPVIWALTTHGHDLADRRASRQGQTTR